MGYVKHEPGVTREYIEAGSYEIEQANCVYTARASLTPMYDPRSERTRS